MYKDKHRNQPLARLLLAACGVALIGFTGWVLSPSVAPPATGTNSAAAASKSAVPRTPPVTKADVLAETRPHFGLSAPQVPFSGEEIRRLTDSAGRAPTLLQYFTKWNQPFRSDAVDASYKRGALPVISWEPWEGRSAGEDQPKYALRKIIAGEHDGYIREFAGGIKAHGKAVGIRIAQEMNGHWYPWSESRSGNRKGEFAQAWRHIHDVFRDAGATNVIWIWSPNILRPVPKVDLRALYPGDAYVDWVGLVGYAVEETTAAAVFEPTIARLRQFTRLPLLITETGAINGPNKAVWIRDFGRWVAARSDLAGFVWFEFSKDQGGSSDWRFTANEQSITAFREALAVVRLAGPPTAGAAGVSPAPSAPPGSPHRQG